MDFYNPLNCDFEWYAAGDKFNPRVVETAQCKHCGNAFDLDAALLKEHVAVNHGHQLPPWYLKEIYSLDAHIPGRGDKPLGYA